MAYSSCKWTVCAKCVLISIGIVCLPMQLKLSIPFFNKTAAYHLPFIMSFLKPPYLYLLINLIILTLILSSRLQRTNSDHHHSPTINASPVSTEKGVVMVDHDEAEFVNAKPVLVNSIKVSNGKNKYEGDDDEIKQVISSSLNNKLLQKEETLESAWKRIMEGRRKVTALSDTWQHHDDRSLALIKEASLSTDELNQRAEAFIHQVNHGMRRQRQESFEQKMLTLGGSR